MTRLLPLVFALALPSTALAWTHTGEVWTADDFSPTPLPIRVADLPGVYGLPTETDGGDSWLPDMIARGFTNWTDVAECVDFQAEVVEIIDVSDSPSSAPGFTFDLQNWMTFDDPADQITEAGTLAATLTRPQGSAGEQVAIGDLFFTHAEDSDIIFNDRVNFQSEDEILNGNCNGGFSIEAVATHEIGHLMGMGHSCEDGEVCEDPVLREATMFWSTDSCELHQLVPNEDDIAGLSVLYGPFATFTCSHELQPGETDTIAIGVVPFELKCAVRSPSIGEISNVTWRWGDGEVTTELEGTHTYATGGEYTVEACFEGTRDSCGDWEFCFERDFYVRACDTVEPDFDIELVDGLKYQLLNETPLDVLGCIGDVQWDIYEGTDVSGDPIDSLTTWESEYTFPKAGDYTVVLNVGGLAGTTSAQGVFTAKRRRGDGTESGCSVAPVGVGGFALIALAAAAGRRRD